MFQDICFVKNNEKEFIDIALKLGTKSLIFVYPDKKSFDKGKKEFSKEKKIKLDFGIILDEKNFINLGIHCIVCKYCF